MNYLAPFAALLALSAVRLNAQAPGSLTFERWTGIPGGLGINFLKEKGISQRPADVSELSPGAAASQNLDTLHGVRMRGTFSAPVTGNYTFFISSDDNGELWLSETSSGMDKRPIAMNDTQHSRMFTLQAGQECYIEALTQQEKYSDQLSIGWSYEPPVALQQTDIGSPGTASWTEADGTYSASAVSGDIWGNSDSCSTSLRPWSGDGEFITRITSMNSPDA